MSEWASNWARLPEIGQIWDFGSSSQNVLKLILKFGTNLTEFDARQNVLKLILKGPIFVTFGTNLTQFGANLEISAEEKNNRCANTAVQDKLPDITHVSPGITGCQEVRCVFTFCYPGG